MQPVATCRALHSGVLPCSEAAPGRQICHAQLSTYVFATQSLMIDTLHLKFTPLISLMGFPIYQGLPCHLMSV